MTGAILELLPSWERVGAAASFTLQHMRDTLLTPGHPMFMMAAFPVIGYWAVAGFYELLDHCPHPSVARFRVTRASSGRPNSVTRRQVLVRVLLQQLLQTALGYLCLLLDNDLCTRKPQAGPLQTVVQFAIATFIMDSWQYWIHRWMHVSTFLYKHIHSTHHRLTITYAMGALYNHPVEALLLDTVGAGISAELAGMSCETSAWFFLFSTVKTVFDHCAYRWPLNPVHDLFPNSASYHDVHHDMRGIKKNFSQPFFTWWDHLCGTHLDPAQFHLTQQQVDAKLGLAGGADGGSKPPPADGQRAEAQKEERQPEGGKRQPLAAGECEDGASAQEGGIPVGSSGGAEEAGSDHERVGARARRAVATPRKAAAEADEGAEAGVTGVTTRSRARRQHA